MCAARFAQEAVMTALSVPTVRRTAIIWFLALAFLLTWPLLLAARSSTLPFAPLLILGSWMPNIAAFLALGWVMREPGGIRRLLAGWTRWRVAPVWYLVALSPLAVALLAAALHQALGGATTPRPPVDGSTILGAALVALITGATGEELGWRGFLLPRLQITLAALPASLVVGAIWALWHLPLWFLPGRPWMALPYWAFAVVTITTSILYTWLVNSSGGSLLLVSLMHLAMNFGGSLVELYGWMPAASYYAGMAALYTVYALLVVWWAGPATLARRHPRITPLVL
jgi:membrane protease YdiL (CAAX protease family)